MSKHDHVTCDHVVAHCKHCDVVYCKNCSVEWSKPKVYTPKTNPYPFDNLLIKDVLYANNTGGDISPNHPISYNHAQHDSNAL